MPAVPIRLHFIRLTLQKLHPLTISRGTYGSSENLFVIADDGEHKGIGELSPASGKNWSADRGEEQLHSFWNAERHSAMPPEEIWQEMRSADLDPPAIAALDVALWDLAAKRTAQPLYKLLGHGLPTVPTSVTAGLNPPEVTRVQAGDTLGRTRARCLKVKLGSPEGLDYDKAHFLAAREAALSFGARLRVDANGGWNVESAKHMMEWLAERGVDYVEQPLPEGSEDELPRLFENRALPIFVDESCRFADDFPKFEGVVDGVNLKFMKCGGVTGAEQIIRRAQGAGLQLMIGCMSESSIAIAGGAAVTGEMDHIDLDSHLNLNPDPAEGVDMIEGVITPRNVPGHGAELKQC